MLRGRKQKKGERAPRDELKTRDQLKKDLKQKEKNKVKQMSKKDREVYLKKKALRSSISGIPTRGMSDTYCIY